MSNHNEITGDKLISKVGDKKKFDEGYDRIFTKKNRPIEPEYIPHWVLGCEECLTHHKEKEDAS